MPHAAHRPWPRTLNAGRAAGRTTVRALLADYGALRLRGTAVTAESFGQSVALVADAPLLEYVNRSTPRSRVHGQVCTSTEYRSDQTIHLHSEQSYAATWPAVLGLWCTTPATSGGETPLASTTQVLKHLPADLVARFQAHGVRYDRWYRPGLDVSWAADTFQTDDRAEVDRLCAKTGITTEWHDDSTVLHEWNTQPQRGRLYPCDRSSAQFLRQEWAVIAGPFSESRSACRS